MSITYVFKVNNDLIESMMKHYDIDNNTFNEIYEKLNLKDNLIASSKDYKNGKIKMKSGITFSFNPDTFELDNIKVLSSNLKNNQYFITINGFPLSEEQDNILKENKTQQDKSQRAFSNLGRDALYSILLKTDPKDVKSLCVLNKKFAKLCQDKTTFINLINENFPESVYTDDPRKQFYGLVDGVETHYKLRSSWNGTRPEDESIDINTIIIDQPPIVFGKSVIPEELPGYKIFDSNNSKMQAKLRSLKYKGRDTPKNIRDLGKPNRYHADMSIDDPNDDNYLFTTFNVLGYQIPAGTKMIALIQFSINEDNIGYPATIDIFKTKEQAVDFYIKSNYDRFLDFYHWLKNELIESNHTFDDYLRERNASVIPYTKENLYDYFMKNDYVYVSDDSDDHALLREITF